MSSWAYNAAPVRATIFIVLKALQHFYVQTRPTILILCCDYYERKFMHYADFFCFTLQNCVYKFLAAACVVHKEIILQRERVTILNFFYYLVYTQARNVLHVQKHFQLLHLLNAVLYQLKNFKSASNFWHNLFMFRSLWGEQTISILGDESCIEKKDLARSRIWRTAIACGREFSAGVGHNYNARSSKVLLRWFRVGDKGCKSGDHQRTVVSWYLLV